MLNARLLLMECEIKMREQRSIREDGISVLVKTSNRFLKKNVTLAATEAAGFGFWFLSPCFSLVLTV